MTNRVISQAAIWIFLGTVLIVWFGCGGSDDSRVDKPTTAKDSSIDDTGVDNPPPVMVDASTDNVSVGNPRTGGDAPG